MFHDTESFFISGFSDSFIRLFRDDADGQNTGQLKIDVAAVKHTCRKGNLLPLKSAEDSRA